MQIDNVKLVTKAIDRVVADRRPTTSIFIDTEELRSACIVEIAASLEMSKEVLVGIIFGEFDIHSNEIAILENIVENGLD